MAAAMAATVPRPRTRWGPQGRFFAGLPTVGVLFAVDRGMRAHTCTASVVHSPHHDVVLTAAHCLGGSHRAFVPMYDGARGADRARYGVWAVSGGWRPAGWTSRGAGSDLDVSFLRLRPDAAGRRVEDLTGGNRLTRATGYVHRVTVVGYPDAGPHNRGDRALECTARTSRLPGRRQLRFVCGGFYGGTSGAPFLTGVDPRTGAGDVIGEIGGWNGGGPADGSDRISYAPLYGDEAFRQFAAAAAG